MQPSYSSVTAHGTLSFGAPLHSVAAANAVRYHDVGSLCVPPPSYGSLLEQNKLTVLPPVKIEHLKEESGLGQYEIKPMDEGKKSESKKQMDTSNSDPVVVQLKGLPKDVTLHEIAGLFGEKSFNLVNIHAQVKLFSC